MRLIYAIRPEPDAQPDEAAATWLSLLLSGDASDMDREAIETWRAASPENADAWDKVASIWDYSPIEAETPAILRMREAALSRPKQARRTWFPAAIAASLALAFVGAGLYSGRVIPGQNAGSGGPAQIASREIRTAVGQQQQVALEDGSHLTVNTASTVQVAFTATTRKVDLTNGEAFFRVARDPQRPFVVNASGLTVTAVGTQFSVRKMDSEVDVVLVEGHVRVEQGEGEAAQSTMLKPGQQLRATAAGFDVSPIDAGKSTSWITGTLSFEATPLRDALAELNRYSAHPIVLANPELGTIPVTGRFKTTEPRVLVSMLTASGLVRSAPQADGSLKLQAAR